MICFSNEKEAAIKEINKYKRWKTEKYKNISQNNVPAENSNNTILMNIKNTYHMRKTGKTAVK